MIKFIINAILFQFLFGFLIIAQDGGIKGKIVDSKTKQPIAGANVWVVDTEIGAATDDLGYFYIQKVPQGLYQIKISSMGYLEFIKPDVRVKPGKITQVEEIGMTESTIEYEAITVTAGAFQDSDDTPVSSYNFTKDEIKRSPGAAGDIFRALSVLPGVATEGGEFSAFSVRGSGPRDNIILVDNIPFTKLSHFDDGGLEGESAKGGRFSIFTNNLVESASFHAGGFPARYGGKNASIINLGIKEGNFDDITVYGHYDLFGWEANYDGPLPINKNSGLIVSARQVNFKTILNMVGETGHGIPKYNDLIVKATSEIDENNKISILSIYADDYNSRTPKNVFESGNINENEINDEVSYRFLIGGNWRTLLGNSGFIQNSVYYYRDKMHGLEGRINTAPDYGIKRNVDNSYYKYNIYDDKRNERTFGLKSDLTLSLTNNIDMFAGIEAKQNTYSYDMKMNGTDTIYSFSSEDYRPDPSQKYLIINPDQYNQSSSFDDKYYAAYLESSFRSGALTFNPGVRVDHYLYNRKSYLSPRFSIRYKLNSYIALNTATGIYYQIPEWYILAMDNRNKSLKNEKALHFILGSSIYLSNDLKLVAETYYKKLEDLAVRSDRGDMIFTNSGKGWAGGFDLSLVKRFSDDYYGQISYSYTQSKRNDNDGKGEYDYEFSKPHMFNIMGGVQLTDNWSVTAKWYISSGYPVDSYVIYSNVLNNPDVMRYSKESVKRADRRLDYNHSLNIRVDYRTQFKYFALNLYADVLNVYGKSNITSEDFLPQSGEITSETLEAIPTIGFSLEF